MNSKTLLISCLTLCGSLLLVGIERCTAEEITPTIAQAEIQIGQLQVALGQAHMQILDLQKKLAEAEKERAPKNLATPSAMNCGNGSCTPPENGLKAK